MQMLYSGKRIDTFLGDFLPQFNLTSHCSRIAITEWISEWPHFAIQPHIIDRPPIHANGIDRRVRQFSALQDSGDDPITDSLQIPIQMVFDLERRIWKAISRIQRNTILRASRQRNPATLCAKVDGNDIGRVTLSVSKRF